MAAAQDIVERFGNQLPDTMEDLVTLRGVGRKTANVVLGHVHGKPGLVVDTHVRRVSFRLGLTKSREPEVIEQDLCAILPPSDWTPFSMRADSARPAGLQGAERRDARNARCFPIARKSVSRLQPTSNGAARKRGPAPAK